MEYMRLISTSLLILFFLGSGCGQKQSKEELSKQATEFEQQGKYEESLHALLKLSSEFPENPELDRVLHKTAFLYYNNLNDFQKSIEFHQKLVDKFPASTYTPQSRFMIGFIYANDLKNYERAEVAYKDFMKNHDSHELSESVKWELEHLGRNVNDQLQQIFGDEKATEKSTEK